MDVLATSLQTLARLDVGLALLIGSVGGVIIGAIPGVGPAIAIIWGWVPAMIWIFVGSIVMGAVHDFGALIISMRNQGKSIINEKFIGL